MNKTYIIADLRLFEEEQRNLLGYETYEEMNNYVIKSWNHTVKENENVIIMGDIGQGTAEEIMSVISKLNGVLWYTSKTAKEQFTKDEWTKIGIDHVWSVPLFKTYDNGDEAYYPIQPIKALSVYEKQYRVVVVDHNNPIDGMAKGILLTADAAKWGYAPLDTDELITIHDNMIEFESMGSEEEHRSDIKEEGEE